MAASTPIMAPTTAPRGNEALAGGVAVVAEVLSTVVVVLCPGSVRPSLVGISWSGAVSVKSVIVTFVSNPTPPSKHIHLCLLWRFGDSV